MIGVYSFWHKPYGNRHGGYLSDRHMLSSMSLSVHYSKKLFDKVVLYCDPHLVPEFEKLGLFDEIIPCFEDIASIPVRHWAVCKMKVYSMQTEPFWHIDNDVMLTKDAIKDFFDAELVAQCVETWEDFGYNYESQVDALDNYYEVPLGYLRRWKEMHKDMGLDFSYNAGVIGGNDWLYMAEYARLGLEFMLKHGWALPDINTTIEQAYFGIGAQLSGRKVTCLLSNWRDKTETRDALRIGYRHYWGGTKKNVNKKTGKYHIEEVCEELAELRPELPEIIQTVKL